MNLPTTLQKASARKGIFVGFVAAACFLITAPQIAAQKNDPGKQLKQQEQQIQQDPELKQAKQRARKYSKKLQGIQESTLKNNPELEKRRKSYQELREKKLKKKVSDDASRSEQIKAQMKLRQDKELRQKREDLQQDFLQAMKDEDPKTQEYLDKLTEARKKIQELSRKQPQGQGQSKMRK